MKIDMDENDCKKYLIKFPLYNYIYNVKDVFNKSKRIYPFFFYFSLFTFFIKFTICLIIFLLSKKIHEIIKITEHDKN